jgi:DNA-binding transcriptional MocR family regulator
MPAIDSQRVGTRHYDLHKKISKRFDPVLEPTTDNLTDVVATIEKAMKHLMKFPRRRLFQMDHAARPAVSRPYSSSKVKCGQGDLISSRGKAVVGLLPSYLADARSVQQYSESNPEGALQLSVAESKMLEDWLIPVLNEYPELSSDAIYYQPTPGRPDFRAVFAEYIEEITGIQKGRLKQDGLIVGAGCNAVLENLCITLADPGEAVLIPTPYYAAFEFDLAARAKLHVQPVPTEDYHLSNYDIEPEIHEFEYKLDPIMYYPNQSALDSAYVVIPTCLLRVLYVLPVVACLCSHINSHFIF